MPHALRVTWSPEREGSLRCETPHNLETKMKLSVVNTKTGLAKAHAASVVEATTGKDRANSFKLTIRYEIYFDADSDTWYRYDNITENMQPCAGRRDCEIEVAIGNFEHVRGQAQMRLFR